MQITFRPTFTVRKGEPRGERTEHGFQNDETQRGIKMDQKSTAHCNAGSGTRVGIPKHGKLLDSHSSGRRKSPLHYLN